MFANRHPVIILLIGSVLYMVGSVIFIGCCEEWAASQPEREGAEILDRVSQYYPCPPNQHQIELPNSDFVPDFEKLGVINIVLDYINRAVFHPGSSACFRQSNGFK